MSGGAGTSSVLTRTSLLGPVYLLSILFAASTLSCAPAPEPAPRVKIPNATPEATVVLPDGWEVNTAVYTRSPSLTLRRVRTTSAPARMFPELSVLEWQPPASVDSLRTALAWEADRGTNRPRVTIAFRDVDGVELATWTRRSDLIVDFVGGTGANIPMRSHSAAVTVSGRYFQCIVQRDDDDAAPAANDEQLVARLCAGIRVARPE